MRPVSSAPMPASGSSSRSTRGAVARHIAISSWRLAPWLSVRGDALRVAVEAGGGERAPGDRDALAIARSAAPRRATACGARACAARRQFSSTLNSAKIVVRW